jgi:hypothetical protein
MRRLMLLVQGLDHQLNRLLVPHPILLLHHSMGVLDLPTHLFHHFLVVMMVYSLVLVLLQGLQRIRPISPPFLCHPP